MLGDPCFWEDETDIVFPILSIKCNYKHEKILKVGEKADQPRLLYPRNDTVVMSLGCFFVNLLLFTSGRPDLELKKHNLEMATGIDRKKKRATIKAHSL